MNESEVDAHHVCADVPMPCDADDVQSDTLQTDFPGSFRANLFDLLFFLFDFDALGFVSPLGKVHIRRIFAVGNAR